MSGDHNDSAHGAEFPLPDGMRKHGNEAATIARAVEECKGPVKPFTVLQTPERRAHRTTIELLKEMLEEAESGNVTEIVMVGFRANGDYLQLASPTMNHTTRIAALENLKFEIQMAHYAEEHGTRASG